MVAVTVVSTKAGDALAGPNGFTLYIRTKDPDGTSTCTTGECAEAWGALKGDASKVQAGAGVSGTFGTATWADGTKQVTHNGRPLYYYTKDAAPGDAQGQGRGGTWCIAPIGAASGCASLAIPGESASPAFVAPGPAIHASENSDGEY